MTTDQVTGIVQIEQPGAPEVLKYKTITLHSPGPGEVLIDQKAIGVNFLDVFFRNGTFAMPSYPALVGLEAAGVIEAVGAGVEGFQVGDRVAYHSSSGAYVQKRCLPVAEMFKLPDDISFDKAAAVMIKGLTAHMLLKQSHAVKAGDVLLIHAMTGGVGTILSEWARSLGATVIGTVGSAGKKELALSRGFDHVVDLSTEDFAEKVKQVTNGRGINAVYDGTGAATFQRSLELVKEGGTAVLYGWASGMPVIDMEYMERRKIRFVRAVLNDYLKDKETITIALSQIFDLLRSGALKLPSPTIYALSDAAKAHADLESRKTTGSIVLHP